MTDADKARLRAAGVNVPQPLPPGTPIASFRIPHRAVPWKAPHTTRTGHSYKDKTLVDWQETVKLYARLAMAGSKPYSFPVELHMTFWLEPGGRYPDTSNLTKGSEDALEEIVFVNDRQVTDNVARRRFGPEDCVIIAAYASEITEES